MKSLIVALIFFSLGSSASDKIIHNFVGSDFERSEDLSSAFLLKKYYDNKIYRNAWVYYRDNMYLMVLESKFKKSISEKGICYSEVYARFFGFAQKEINFKPIKLGEYVFLADNCGVIKEGELISILDNVVHSDVLSVVDSIKNRSSSCLLPDDAVVKEISMNYYFINSMLKDKSGKTYTIEIDKETRGINCHLMSENQSKTGVNQKLGSE